MSRFANLCKRQHNTQHIPELPKIPMLQRLEEAFQRFQVLYIMRLRATRRVFWAHRTNCCMEAPVRIEFCFNS